MGLTTDFTMMWENLNSLDNDVKSWKSHRAGGGLEVWELL
jgi:hypothetical protein